MIDFSIIIPHRNSIPKLKKLISTIPNSNKIEIIVVDNSDIPLLKNQLLLDRDIQLFYSNKEKGAGGARNVGIDNAHGKWLVFADADDYFIENAFSFLGSQLNNVADIVFFKANCVYSDTGENGGRADVYNRLVDNYLKNIENENDIRLCFLVPWAKMIRRDYVINNSFKFDEVVASNDVFFSLLTGFNAKKICALPYVVYTVTVSRGSLTRRRDKAVVEARFIVKLRYNQFVKEKALPDYQQSIMVHLKQASRFGMSTLWLFVKLLFKYKQNPFVGWNNWFYTVLYGFTHRKDNKYITH